MMALADVPLGNRSAYTLIMLLAMAAGLAVSRVTQSRLRLPWEQRIGILLGAFCGSMLGVRLPFVLTGEGPIWRLESWLGDGKTILVGLIGGYLGVELAKAIVGVRAKTGDSFAVPVAVAIAIGRLACFSIGCCYGTPTELPWGVDFGDGVARHPTQLYEAGFHFLAAAMLYALWRRQLLRYQLLKFYILLYLAYRFLTEWIRPEARLAWGLTAYQWTALAMAPVMLLLWYRDELAKRAEAARSLSDA